MSENANDLDVPDELLDEDGSVEFGGREDALVDTGNTEREWVKHEGKVYWFDIKEISWDQKTRILEQAMETNERTGEIDLSLRDFYRDMMEEVIVDMSVDGGVATFLAGMKPGLGDKVQELLPQPGGILDEDEEGNSAQQ